MDYVMSNVYTARLFHRGQTVLSALYEHPWERRDAVIEALKEVTDAVSEDAIQAILLPAGGTSPDRVLNSVYDLFAEADDRFDLDLDTYTVTAGPVRWYMIAVHKPGNSAPLFQLYPTAVERWRELYSRLLDERERIAGPASRLPTKAETFDSEADLLTALNRVLSFSDTTVTLHEALRYGDGSYVSE